MGENNLILPWDGFVWLCLKLEFLLEKGIEMSQIENNEKYIACNWIFPIMIFPQTPCNIQDQEIVSWIDHPAPLDKHVMASSEHFEIFDLPHWVLNHYLFETLNFEGWKHSCIQNKYVCDK